MLSLFSSSSDSSRKRKREEDEKEEAIQKDQSHVIKIRKQQFKKWMMDLIDLYGDQCEHLFAPDTWQQWKISQQIQSQTLLPASNRLTSVLCIEIVSYLHFSERCRMKSVAYLWKETANHYPLYWKKTMINLTTLEKFKPLSMMAINWYKHLFTLGQHCETLQLYKAPFPFMIKNLITTKLIKLNKLILTDVPLTPAVIHELYKMPFLTHLEYEQKRHPAAMAMEFYGLPKVRPWKTLILKGLFLDFVVADQVCRANFQDCETLILKNYHRKNNPNGGLAIKRIVDYQWLAIMPKLKLLHIINFQPITEAWKIANPHVAFKQLSQMYYF